jgi:hypothetical protein
MNDHEQKRFNQLYQRHVRALNSPKRPVFIAGDHCWIQTSWPLEW